MKDRLIEMMMLWGNENTDSFNFEGVADYLIANGVIVPPCKVGQTIYYNCCGTIFKGTCHAITIHENSIQVHLYDFDGDNASYSAKDVYTSREEAERAIKGGAE